MKVARQQSGGGVARVRAGRVPGGPVAGGASRRDSFVVPRQRAPVVRVSALLVAMNREYFPSAYLQLTELQPAQHYIHHHYDLAQASSSATSYNMTAGGSEGGCNGPPAPALPPALHQHHHDPRKRRISHFSDEYEAMSGCDVPLSAPMAAPAARRRKTSSYGAGSAYDDDGEDSRSTRISTLPDKKQNHSEIEKRRRDKMNTYISELSAMVPMCGAMARKLDKLTVLRMAVQHLRSVRGALSSGPLTACPRPAYVTERELNDLVLAAGRDAFVLVVGCDRGRLLYVSASVTAMLHYDKAELLGQSLFDILHPKDVAKVKEQLSSSDLSPRERLIDAKTMLPVKAETGSGATRLCPGARRSFFCRVKTKTVAGPEAPPGPTVKEELEAAAKMRKKHERKYCVVQCTGYLKSWAPAEMTEGGEEGGFEGPEEEACNLTCLVAVGRALRDLAPAPAGQAAQSRPTTRNLQFLSRHANDGKYLFVDQRVTLALGFLPQELLGTSLYEYVSGSELGVVARAHKAALVRRDALRTAPYAVRCKDGSHALLQTHFKPFRNPWTKDVECLVAENTVVTDAPAQQPYDDHHHGEGSCANGAGAGVGAGADASDCDAEVQRLIESQVESHKIGSAIAEEALRRSPAGLALDLPPDLLHDALLYNPVLVDNMLNDDATHPTHQIRNNVPLSVAAEAGEQSPAEAPGSPASMTLDGNGEAAMAVIMSLLEADAGLGGPVNFSGLPWPLP